MSTSQPAFDVCGNCDVSKGAEDAPLKVCNGCGVRKYCSRDCQTEHWAFHKHFCQKLKVGEQSKVANDGPKPTSNIVWTTKNIKPDSEAGGEPLSGPGRGVGASVHIRIIRVPDAASGYGYAYSAITELPPQHIQDHFVWTEIPIAKALGFPLRMLVVGDKGANRPNEFANWLGFDPDPASPSFGQIQWHGRPMPTGSALIVRQDGKEIHIGQVSTLVEYLRDGLKEIKDVKKKESKGTVVDREELAAKFLTPVAFRKWFEETKSVQVLADPKVWRDVKCPVDVSKAEGGASKGGSGTSKDGAATSKGREAASVGESDTLEGTKRASEGKSDGF